MTLIYSLDGSEFRHEDEGDVFAEMASDGNLVEGAEYFSADFVKMRPENIFNTNRFLEQLDETICDEANLDDYTAFADTPESIVNELNEVVFGWITKRLGDYPVYRCTGNITTHIVTKEQVADYYE